MPIVTCKVNVPEGTTTGTINRQIHEAGYRLESCVFPAKASAIKKGGAWEREFAKTLSLWYTKGEDKYVFERRSGSGGSLRDKTGKSGEAGDIVAIKAEGKELTNKMVFELKFYKDLAADMWSLLTNECSETSQVGGWWVKVLEEAARYDRKACLILRINNKKPLVMTNATMAFSPMMGTMCTLKLFDSPVWIFPMSQWLALDSGFSPESFLVSAQVKQLRSSKQLTGRPNSRFSGRFRRS